MILVSIDPGLKGYLSVLKDGYPITFFAMPTVKKGSKNRVDVDALAKFIKDCNPDKAVVEHVGASPRMGSASAFSFGYSFAGVLGVLAGYGVEYDTITPQKWKVIFGLLGESKDAARILVLKNYPELTKHFKLKKHIDKAESLLIGLAWILRNMNDSKS